MRTRFDPVYGEHEGGTDIYPDASGAYHLFDEDELRVQAAPMQHTIPCVGYVITEKTRPGRLKFEAVRDVVERNKAALKESLKLPDANKVYAVLKSMRPGSKLAFPDGSVIYADDILEPPRAGRKVVVSALRMLALSFQPCALAVAPSLRLVCCLSSSWATRVRAR